MYRWVLLAILVAAGGRDAAAQSGAELLTRGVQAYQALAFAEAVPLLQESLAQDSIGVLSPDGRAQALCYLAAAQLFGHDHAGATETFRALVRMNPRLRPDKLIFPPQVTDLFLEVYKSTRAYATEAAPESRLRPGVDRLLVELYGSLHDDVSVAIARDDGTAVRKLYVGPIMDSVALAWDGLTAARAAPAEGRYLLQVTAAGTDGPPWYELPLDIERLPVDTLPWPAAPDTVTPTGTPLVPSDHDADRSLAAGIVPALFVVALPGLVARGTHSTGDRLLVGATIGVAGVIGFLVHRIRRSPGDVRGIDISTRENWRRRLAAVQAENAARRAGATLLIKVGHPTAVSPGDQ
ncbi:MAG TPA: hypothetical protein VFI39_06590 [Gemmatimonadales bacterium]|nr:hypothetical protein [Gemmatimonadales bacterium]